MVRLSRKAYFREGLQNPKFFRNRVRRLAYILARNDPERVHEMALRALNKYTNVIEEISPNFDFPNLHIDFYGRKIMPFGPAEGLDKNGDALYPLSHLFGFIPWGTVVVHPRPGNPRPRIAVDNKNDSVYNAQGFPHRGLRAAVENAEMYNGKAPLLTSICGIPPSPQKLDVAYGELETLVRELEPYSFGFVWNPFSPNTDALTALRTPKVFRESAELITRIAGKDRPLLVKIGPYDGDPEKKRGSLSLIEAFLEGGGNGVIAVNTHMVPKEQVPSRNWGYPSAGESGTKLRSYRQRAIKDIRGAFPETFIIAAGGINSADEAFASFTAANALVGYTPYTFDGFGLLPEMAMGVEAKLNELGYKTLIDFQRDRGFV